MGKRTIQLDMFDGRRNSRNPKLPMPLESVEQEALFRWAAWAQGKFPELALMHHNANGGRRDFREAQALKRRGVLAGIPDVCLPVPRNGYGSLYIELKRVGKGESTSPAQKAVIGALRAVGNVVHVCEGWEEAKKRIEEYLS